MTWVGRIKGKKSKEGGGGGGGYKTGDSNKTPNLYWNCAGLKPVIRPALCGEF